MPSLLKAVRQLVGADSAAFFWVNARGDMTALFAERLLPAPVGSSISNVSTNPASRRSARLHVTLAAGRTGDRCGRLRGRGTHRVLQRSDAPPRRLSRAVWHRPRTGRGAWPVEPVPAEVDQHVLVGAARGTDVDHALCRARRFAAAARFCRREGFLDRGRRSGVSGRTRRRVRQLPTAAHKLLALATHGGIGPEQIRSDVEEAALPALRQLVAQLHDGLAGAEVAPPCLVVDNAWGRFVLRAYALSDEPLVTRCSGGRTDPAAGADAAQVRGRAAGARAVAAAARDRGRSCAGRFESGTGRGAGRSAPIPSRITSSSSSPGSTRTTGNR